MYRARNENFHAKFIANDNWTARRKGNGGGGGSISVTNIIYLIVFMDIETVVSYPVPPRPVSLEEIINAR